MAYGEKASEQMSSWWVEASVRRTRAVADPEVALKERMASLPPLKLGNERKMWWF